MSSEPELRFRDSSWASISAADFLCVTAGSRGMRPGSRLRPLWLILSLDDPMNYSGYVTSPPSETAPRSRRFSSATRSPSTFRGKRRRKLHVVDARWDDTKVVQPDGCGQARRRWKGGCYPLAGGSDDSPSKPRTPSRPRRKPRHRYLPDLSGTADAAVPAAVSGCHCLRATGLAVVAGGGISDLHHSLLHLAVHGILQ